MGVIFSRIFNKRQFKTTSQSTQENEKSVENSYELGTIRKVKRPPPIKVDKSFDNFLDNNKQSSKNKVSYRI